MKQVKFFLAILITVVMGVSVTSCMKGEENTIVPVSGIITLKNTFPYQFQVEGSNVVFEARSLTIPGLSTDASPGDIILLYSQYDSSTQQVDQNTKKIIIDASGAMKLNSNTHASLEDVAYNRSILPLGNYGYNVAPYCYSKNWVIIPIPFYIEKEETLSNHAFCLVYDKTHSDNGDNTMVLRLRHSSTEDVTKEKTTFTTYKAFNISYLVSAFEGTSLKNIKIITQEQSGNTPEITEGSTAGYREQGYTIENYDKFK